MAQMTVRLSTELNEALSAAAERLQRKRAEVVRLALRHFLELDQEGKPADRVRGLLGSLQSGSPGLTESSSPIPSGRHPS